MHRMDEHTYVSEEGYPCPSCGHKLDAASSPEGSMPSVGDFTVCINCGSILCFEEPLLKTRPATDEDFAQLDEESLAALRKAQAAVAQIQKAKAVEELFLKHFGES